VRLDDCISVRCSAPRQAQNVIHPTGSDFIGIAFDPVSSGGDGTGWLGLTCENHVGQPSAVKADFAKRLHDGEQTAPFVVRFAVTNLTKDHGASVDQAPHVARSVCSFSCNVAWYLLARKIKHRRPLLNDHGGQRLERVVARSFPTGFARNQLGDEMLELARQRLRQHRHVLGVQ